MLPIHSMGLTVLHGKQRSYGTSLSGLVQTLTQNGKARRGGVQAFFVPYSYFSWFGEILGQRARRRLLSVRGRYASEGDARRNEMTQQAAWIHQEIKTPRAAAVAGILFSPQCLCQLCHPIAVCTTSYISSLIESGATLLPSCSNE